MFKKKYDGLRITIIFGQHFFYIHPLTNKKKKFGIRLLKIVVV